MTVINRVIASHADVEAVAREAEGEDLDYKETQDPAKWWELAKDIAAFANHLGGVILLGAVEEPDGLPDLKGLPPGVVTTLQNAYYDAALKRCQPPALIACVRIPWDDGKEMLAVNVQARADGIIGAQFWTPNKGGKLEATNAWQFPLRVVRDNQPMPLEQAMLHMSSRTRRAAILLEGIPEAERAAVQFLYIVPSEGRPYRLEAKIGRVEVAKNMLPFSVANSGITVVHSQFMPLDDVDTVWEAGGRWTIRVTGFFEMAPQTNISAVALKTYQSTRG